MTKTEQQILTILTDSPQTWRQLLPPFPDRAEFNIGLLHLAKNKMVDYNISGGYYEITKP
jgi:hypothetical protein